MAASDGHELRAVDIFLQSNMEASTALMALLGNDASRIGAGLIPQSAGYPCVTYDFHPGTPDNNAVGAIRVFTRPLYLVKVVTEAPGYKSAGPIITAVEQAIVGESQVVTIDGIDWQIMGCYRQEPIRYPEVLGGVRYNHVGGLYRIFVHKKH